MNLAVLYYIYVRRKKKRYRKTNNLNHITLLHAFEMCAHCFYSILLNQSSINLSVVIINLCNHLNHSFIENLIIMFNFSNVRRPSFALQMRLNNCDLININYYIPPLCPEFEHEIYLFGVCCKFKECKWSETNNRKTSRHDNKMIPYRESVPLKKSPHIRADVVIKRNGAHPHPISGLISRLFLASDRRFSVRAVENPLVRCSLPTPFVTINKSRLIYLFNVSFDLCSFVMTNVETYH